MDKYVISQRREKEMVIEDFPSDLDHIPVILNDDLPSAEAYELVLDMLHSDSSVRVMMIGESCRSASVLSCEAQISSHLDIYSATFDTVSEVEHVWSSAVAGLERLQVLWVRRGLAVLVSRSALPAGLPRLKSPNPRGKGDRGRGGHSRLKSRRNVRGPQSYRAHDELRLEDSAAGGRGVQLAAHDRGASSKNAASSWRSEDTSGGTRSRTWTASDKPSKSRWRSAKEKSLGDFLFVDGLQTSKDTQKVLPGSAAATKPESKKVLNNKENLNMVRPLREPVQALASGNLSAEDQNSSKPGKRGSPTQGISDNFTNLPEESSITLGSSNDAYNEEPSSGSVEPCKSDTKLVNNNQISEVQDCNSNSMHLESSISMGNGDKEPKSTEVYDNLEALPADHSATSQRIYDKKKHSSNRKVGFHLPLVPQTATETSCAVDGPSVRPKTGTLGSPQSKRNNSKNKRKKDDGRRKLNEYSTPVKNQGVPAKVC